MAKCSRVYPPSEETLVQAHSPSLLPFSSPTHAPALSALSLICGLLPVCTVKRCGWGRSRKSSLRWRRWRLHWAFSRIPQGQKAAYCIQEARKKKIWGGNSPVRAHMLVRWGWNTTVILQELRNMCRHQPRKQLHKWKRRLWNDSADIRCRLMKADSTILEWQDGLPGNPGRKGELFWAALISLLTPRRQTSLLTSQTHLFFF